jgi:hypothetical protein
MLNQIANAIGAVAAIASIPARRSRAAESTVAGLIQSPRSYGCELRDPDEMDFGVRMYSDIGT